MIERFCDRGPCHQTRLNFDRIYFDGFIDIEPNYSNEYHEEYRQEGERLYVVCPGCHTEHTLQELGIRYETEDGWAHLVDRRKK